MPRNVSFAISMFGKVGLRTIWAQKEDFYMLIPMESHDRETYGVSTLSPRVMVGIHEHLSGLVPKSSDTNLSGNKELGVKSP